MAKIELGPPGEYMLAHTEVLETKPTGDCAVEGGSDWKNDAGDDGGAMKGSVILGGAWAVELTALPAASAPVGVVSGTRTACPIRFRLFFWYPKQPVMFNQFPHFFFCKHK
jgi:hypothetical protein